MPEAQAEILAEEQARLIDERLATKADLAVLRTDLKALEQRLKDQLTIRVGGMLAVAIAIVATLVKLL